MFDVKKENAKVNNELSKEELLQKENEHLKKVINQLESDLRKAQIVIGSTYLSQVKL